MSRTLCKNVAILTGSGSWIGNSVFQLLYGNEENQLKLGSLWSDQEKRLAAYTPLAMVVRGNGSVEDARNRLMTQFSADDGEGYATSSGVTAHAGARYPYHRYGTKISGCFPQFG